MSVLLKDLPDSSKPRERFIKYGKENLSDEELISIILRCGYKNVNVKEVSLNLLKEIGSIDKLNDITLKELTKIKGIGITSAISLLASLELGKRVNNYSSEHISLKSSTLIYNKYKSYFKGLKQEEMMVVYLDKNFNLIDDIILFKGTVDSSCVHPREIFKYAVKLSSSYFVLIHNHPSGNLDPSEEDIIVTENINRLSLMMGIKLMDHIIITDEYYTSFKDLGIFK